VASECLTSGAVSVWILYSIQAAEPAVRSICRSLRGLGQWSRTWSPTPGMVCGIVPGIVREILRPVACPTASGIACRVVGPSVVRVIGQTIGQVIRLTAVRIASRAIGQTARRIVCGTVWQAARGIACQIAGQVARAARPPDARRFTPDPGGRIPAGQGAGCLTSRASVLYSVVRPQLAGRRPWLPWVPVLRSHDLLTWP
jgi:hypothetical protein